MKHDWKNFNYVSFESILIIPHEINMIIVTYPTTFVHCFRVLCVCFFLGHIVKAFQNNFPFIISTETCFWLKRVSDRTLAIFSSLETRCNTHNQIAIRYAFRNAFLELSRLSSIDLSVSRVWLARNVLSLRICIAQFHPKHNAFKGVSKQLCVYHLFRSVFLSQTRIRSPFFSAFQKGVSNPIIKTALRLSSAKITLKVVWKP